MSFILILGEDTVQQHNKLEDADMHFILVGTKVSADPTF